eukprot:3702128-Rhodomonas_salina.1
MKEKERQHEEEAAERRRESEVCRAQLEEVEGRLLVAAAEAESLRGEKAKHVDDKVELRRALAELEATAQAFAITAAVRPLCEPSTPPRSANALALGPLAGSVSMAERMRGAAAVVAESQADYAAAVAARTRLREVEAELERGWKAVEALQGEAQRTLPPLLCDLSAASEAVARVLADEHKGARMLRRAEAAAEQHSAQLAAAREEQERAEAQCKALAEEAAAAEQKRAREQGEAQKEREKLGERLKEEEERGRRLAAELSAERRRRE